MHHLLKDKELGDIAVTLNVRSRQYVFRFRNGMITCTSPIPYREDDLRQSIDRLRPKLKELIQKGEKKAETRHYTPETRIDTEDFKLKFVQDDVPVADAKMDETGIVCRYRSPEVLAQERVQTWITSTLERFARKRVRERLVPRLFKMAAERGLTFKEAKVSSAKGRWGSCSTQGNINLSLYLVLLPRHLQDYVMQHELTHLIEMNHSPRFWALLDKACGCNSRNLRNEMKAYNTAFV